MSSKSVYTLWGCLFALCACLGFFQPAEGALRVILFVLSLVFFLPPAYLLWRGSHNDRKMVRSFSILSLGLTLALLVLNLLTALGPAFLGALLHNVLVIVSSPMVCSGYWVVSLFLWACLLMGSLKK